MSAARAVRTRARRGSVASVDSRRSSDEDAVAAVSVFRAGGESSLDHILKKLTLLADVVNNQKSGGVQLGQLGVTTAATAEPAPPVAPAPRSPGLTSRAASSASLYRTRSGQFRAGGDATPQRASRDTSAVSSVAHGGRREVDAPSSDDDSSLGVGSDEEVGSTGELLLQAQVRAAQPGLREWSPSLRPLPPAAGGAEGGTSAAASAESPPGTAAPAAGEPSPSSSSSAAAVGALLESIHGMVVARDALDVADEMARLHAKGADAAAAGSSTTAGGAPVPLAAPAAARPAPASTSDALARALVEAYLPSLPPAPTRATAPPPRRQVHLVVGDGRAGLGGLGAGRASPSGDSQEAGHEGDEGGDGEAAGDQATGQGSSKGAASKRGGAHPRPRPPPQRGGSQRFHQDAFAGQLHPHGQALDYEDFDFLDHEPSGPIAAGGLTPWGDGRGGGARRGSLWALNPPAAAGGAQPHLLESPAAAAGGVSAASHALSPQSRRSPILRGSRSPSPGGAQHDVAHSAAAAAYHRASPTHRVSPSPPSHRASPSPPSHRGGPPAPLASRHGSNSPSNSASFGGAPEPEQDDDDTASLLRPLSGGRAASRQQQQRGGSAAVPSRPGTASSPSTLARPVSPSTRALASAQGTRGGGSALLPPSHGAPWRELTPAEWLRADSANMQEVRLASGLGDDADAPAGADGAGFPPRRDQHAGAQQAARGRVSPAPRLRSQSHHEPPSASLASLSSLRDRDSPPLPPSPSHQRSSGASSSVTSPSSRSPVRGTSHPRGLARGFPGAPTPSGAPAAIDAEDADVRWLVSEVVNDMSVGARKSHDALGLLLQRGFTYDDIRRTLEVPRPLSSKSKALQRQISQQRDPPQPPLAPLVSPSAAVRLRSVSVPLFPAPSTSAVTVGTTLRRQASAGNLAASAGVAAVDGEAAAAAPPSSQPGSPPPSHAAEDSAEARESGSDSEASGAPRGPAPELPRFLSAAAAAAAKQQRETRRQLGRSLGVASPLAKGDSAAPPGASSPVRGEASRAAAAPGTSSPSEPRRRAKPSASPEVLRKGRGSPGGAVSMASAQSRSDEEGGAEGAAAGRFPRPRKSLSEIASAGAAARSQMQPTRTAAKWVHESTAALLKASNRVGVVKTDATLPAWLQARPDFSKLANAAQELEKGAAAAGAPPLLEADERGRPSSATSDAAPVGRSSGVVFVRRALETPPLARGAKDIQARGGERGASRQPVWSDRWREGATGGVAAVDAADPPLVAPRPPPLPLLTPCSSSAGG